MDGARFKAELAKARQDLVIDGSMCRALAEMLSQIVSVEGLPSWLEEELQIIAEHLRALAKNLSVLQAKVEEWEKAAR